jgi:hypothetical protein
MKGMFRSKCVLLAHVSQFDEPEGVLWKPEKSHAEIGADNCPAEDRKNLRAEQEPESGEHGGLLVKMPKTEGHLE